MALVADIALVKLFVVNKTGIYLKSTASYIDLS